MWQLVGKPERKEPLRKSRHKRADNIKMDLREIRLGDMVWIVLPQDRDQWRALVNKVMNSWVPLNAGKFLSSFTTSGFSRTAQLHGAGCVTKQK
jgi:hypothetical protein